MSTPQKQIEEIKRGIVDFIDEKELLANVEELIKVIKAPKIKKLVLCATMGPGIKVEVTK